MRIDLFPLFLWERLTWWSLWLNEDETGRADIVGAGTTGLVIALAVVVYLKRESLRGALIWIKVHPLWVTAIIAPVAALALVCLTKFATFIGATLTTVGLLIALDNNRKSHDRETKRFARQGKAAQAALALELSAVVDYCKGVVAELNKVEIGERSRKIGTDIAALSFPSPPPTAAGTFKEMIISTDDQAVSDRCATILSMFQLVRSNLVKLRESEAFYSQHAIEQEKMRAVILYALTGTLYDFSRRRAPSVRSFDWDRVDMSCSALNLDRHSTFAAYYRDAKEHFPGHPFDAFLMPKEAI